MTIGWGIIGCGWFTDNFIAPAVRKSKGADLIAFLSRSQDKAKKFMTKHNAKAAYSDMNAFLQDDRIEVVFIGTPNSLHHSQAIKAAEANKHVFCEKPMALHSIQCREMIAACHKSGVNLMVGYMLRFHPAHQEIKSLTTNGDIGKIIMLRCQFYVKYNEFDEGRWRMDPLLAGGGSLMDLGTHCLDLLEFLNTKIIEVSSFMNTLTTGSSVEDTLVANLHFQNDSYGMVDVCYSIDIGKERYLEIYGDQGYVRTVGTISGYGGGKMEIVENGESRIASYPPLDLYLPEIDEFNASIRENREPAITGEDGLRNLEIVEAIYRGAKKKTVEKIQSLQ